MVALKRALVLSLASSLGAALTVGLLGLAACGARPQPRETAQVRFILEPATARVYVEDRFVGAARLLRVRPRTFPTGRRHFTITAEGYFPHDVALDLPAGETTIRLSLRPIPP